MTIKTANIKVLTEVNVAADIFIVPNSACKIEHLFEERRNYINNQMKNICKLNGMEFDKESDLMFEYWIVCNDLNTDNLRAHGGYITDEFGNKYRIEFQPFYLPLKIFEGHKEGETIDIKLPLTVSLYEYNKLRYNVDANIKMTLAQTKYKYRNNGNFEDALEYVMSNN